MTLKNTKDNATIKMVSTQRAGSEQNSIEFTTSGGFYQRNGKFFITYEEHADMGMGNSRVLLKAEEEQITMRRTGEFQTVMAYKLFEVTEFIYRMPYGELNLKIKTESIENALCENGGFLRFSYKLFAGGEETETEIRIDIERI